VPEFQTYCYIEGDNFIKSFNFEARACPAFKPYCIEGYHISSSSIFYISFLDIYPMGVYYDAEKKGGRYETI